MVNRIPNSEACIVKKMIEKYGAVCVIAQIAETLYATGVAYDMARDLNAVANKYADPV
jgi:hypothetical protein